MRKVRKGDEVIVLRGGDRGRTGKVVDVDPKSNRVTVEGVNQVKKHVKRTAKNLKSGINTISAPLPMAAVALVGKDGKAVRVHFEAKETTAGKVNKVRVATRTNQQFD